MRYRFLPLGWKKKKERETQETKKERLKNDSSTLPIMRGLPRVITRHAIILHASNTPPNPICILQDFKRWATVVKPTVVAKLVQCKSSESRSIPHRFRQPLIGLPADVLAPCSPYLRAAALVAVGGPPLEGWRVGERGGGGESVLVGVLCVGVDEWLAGGSGVMSCHGRLV